jgi:predicted transposase
MKLVANIQLTPTKDEAKRLRQALEACNAACNAASQLGFEKFGPKKVRQLNLQKVVYRRLRDDFGLTAQAAIRSIAKVAGAYKTAKANGHKLEEPVSFASTQRSRTTSASFGFCPVSIRSAFGR